MVRIQLSTFTDSRRNPIVLGLILVFLFWKNLQWTAPNLDMDQTNQRLRTKISHFDHSLSYDVKGPSVSENSDNSNNDRINTTIETSSPSSSLSSLVVGNVLPMEYEDRTELDRENQEEVEEDVADEQQEDETMYDDYANEESDEEDKEDGLEEQVLTKSSMTTFKTKTEIKPIKKRNKKKKKKNKKTTKAAAATVKTTKKTKKKSTSQSALTTKKTKKKKKTKTKNKDESTDTATSARVLMSCLDPNGPIPVILMGHGRAGSGLIWKTLSNLTGYQTMARRPFSEMKPYLEQVEGTPSDNGEWAIQHFCLEQGRYLKQHKQHSYYDAETTTTTTTASTLPTTPMVGMRLTPYLDALQLDAGQRFMKRLGDLSDASNAGTISDHVVIRVIRARRNELDAELMRIRKEQMQNHPSDDQRSEDDEEGNSYAITVPNVNHLYEQVQQKQYEEERVDELLKEYHVPTVTVSFEELVYPSYGSTNPDWLAHEWNNILAFLDVPNHNHTFQEIKTIMGMKVAGETRPHRQIIRNYEDVYRVFQGTKLEGLLRQ